MKFITRLRVWFRQWRRRKAFTKQKADLREFVYLDEVSVYSLIASRLGPIAAEFTETQTESLQGEVGGSLGAGLSNTKAEVSSRALSGQTHGSQVLRKSTVQATFKELYEYELERDTFVMKPLAEDLELPRIRSIEELIQSIPSLVFDGWIVDPGKLKRGQLLEAEIQLESEAIYQVSTMVSSLSDIILEDPKLFGDNLSNQLLQMESIGRILEKLLVGLVPIRGQVIDYCIAEFEEKAWIVHNKLFKELPESEMPSTRLLYVVGVAEQSLFWKDIRRILFSKARFRVLCRMAQDGLRDSWTPVKLAHVLEALAPELANQINIAGSNTFANLSKAGKFTTIREQKQRSMYNALIGYATLLADHYSLALTSQDTEIISQLADQNSDFNNSQKDRREAFGEIAKFLHERFDLKREPDIFADYRVKALSDAGLDFSGQVLPLIAQKGNTSTNIAVNERFIDTEFIAIYW